MSPVLAALAGGLLGGGLVAALRGLFEAPSSSTPLSTGLWTRWAAMPPEARRRIGIRVGIGILGGVGALAATGWPVLLVAVPTGVMGVPALLGNPPNRDIELLQALDRWLRGLASTLGTGKSISDAIRLSRRMCPPVLAEPVANLVTRLDDRWTARDALQAFADELASADADAAVAALILAAQRGGTGAASTLHALSDWVQDRLKALRAIETERAKPRTVVRQVTGITLVVLGISFVWGGDFFEPYSSPLGQALLAALIAAYAVSLVILRRMTVPRRRDRVLRAVAS